MAVDRQRRIRFVRGQNEIDSLACSAERWVVERPLRKHRRVSRGNQQRVAFTQRTLEPLGKTQNHLPARQRSAGFDKTQMPGRDLGTAGERELTEAPPLPPFAQMPANPSGCG